MDITLLTLYQCDFETLYRAFGLTAQMRKLAKEGTFEVSGTIVEYENGEPFLSKEEEDKVFEGSTRKKIKDRLG
jgi:uncharacterized protein YlaN (UPF0358 family)